MFKRSLLLMAFVAAAIGVWAQKANKSVDITIGDETRSYWLYVPSSMKRNCPLVISLHGANGHSDDRSPFRTDMANKAGCIVAYPQGKLQHFPVFGSDVTGWDASGEDNEDVDFIKAIIEDIAAKYTINRKKIYCCGFSNGGMMTYALTNTCSDIFAAYASISGFPLNEFHFRHTGFRPVPFLHIHGKQDGFVRYDLMPVIVDEMVARLGANPIPQKTSVSGKYDKSIYEAAEGSFPYIYYEIDNMGHNDYTSDTELGSSAQTMWDFFEHYTLDTPCDTTLKWLPRVETEGYTPKSHGWTVNSGLTLLRFGGDQNTDGKQNVYRSLQLTTGEYKLVFCAEGETCKTVSVRLQKLTGKKNTVVNASVEVGKDADLRFKIEDGWGEYKLTLSRPSSSDQISISNLGIYSLTQEEIMSVKTSYEPQGRKDGLLYNLSGQLLGQNARPPRNEIVVVDNKKVLMP